MTPEQLNTLAWAEAEAKAQLKKFGLHDWSFIWSKKERAFGTCHYRMKAISLSKILTPNRTKENILDTILHEIAHALTPGAGHGPEWKRMCVKIGCKPHACRHDEEVQPVGARFRAVCKNGHEFMRNRLPKRTTSCGKCCSHFNPEFVLNYVNVKNPTQPKKSISLMIGKMTQKQDIINLAAEGKTINEIVALRGYKKTNVSWYFSKLKLHQK